MRPDYDSIVVGAGAGGLIAAAVLAESGRRVLLLERGPQETYASLGHRDHLRNQRLSTYGHNAGPDIDGNPRVLVDPDGNATSASRTNRATRTTPPSSGAERWSTAGRPGASCPTIFAWRAPTACPPAPR